MPGSYTSYILNQLNAKKKKKADGMYCSSPKEKRNIT